MKRLNNYSNKKLFVFDMIGTLTDERHLVSGILQKLLPQYSYKYIKKNYELYKVNEISKTDFWNKFKIKDIDEMEKLFLEKIIIRDGMLELLQEMKKDFKLAILSNIPRELGHLISKKYNFEKYFDEIVFSGDYGIKKPNSEIYKLLLNKFPDIKSSKTYFIDDSLKDLESGKNLLMNTIWYKSDDVKSNYIPDFIVKDVAQLIKFVEKL
jgi:HAD superfamily hydrolase (TIGR01509 family)